MEVMYCAKCRTRVTSNEIQSGQAVRADDIVHCGACAEKLGIAKPDAQPKAAVPKRTRPARPSRTAEGPSEPSGGMDVNMKMMVGTLAVVACGLVLLLVILLMRPAPPVPAAAPQPEHPQGTRALKPEAAPETVSVSPQASAAVPEKIKPEPIPVKVEEAVKAVPKPPVPAPAVVKTVPAEKPEAPAREGWIDLLGKGPLNTSGWVHGQAANFEDAFSLEGGVLQRAAGKMRSRVEKKIPFGEKGEFNIEFESKGSYWAIYVMDNWSSMVKIEFTKKEAGRRHTCRIVLNGKTAECYLDGRQFKFNNTLQRSLAKKCSLHFHTVSGIGLKIFKVEYKVK